MDSNFGTRSYMEGYNVYENQSTYVALVFWHAPTVLGLLERAIKVQLQFVTSSCAELGSNASDH